MGSTLGLRLAVVAARSTQLKAIAELVFEGLVLGRQLLVHRHRQNQYQYQL